MFGGLFNTLSELCKKGQNDLCRDRFQILVAVLLTKARNRELVIPQGVFFEFSLW